MLNAILRYFGLAQKEYHHVVSSLTGLVSDLRALEARKLNEAEDAKATIEHHTANATLASAEATQAAAAATKIAALVS